MVITPIALLMRSIVPVFYEEDNLQQAVLSMRRARLRQAPVIDGQRLIGMLDERDCRLPEGSEDEIAQRRAARKRTRGFVAERMRREAPTITPSTCPEEALETLLLRGLETLFVVDWRHHFLGIVTRKELARYFVHQRRTRSSLVPPLPSKPDMPGRRRRISRIRLNQTAADAVPVPASC